MRNSRHDILLLLAVILLCSLALTSCSFSLAEDVTPPPGALPPQDFQPVETTVSGPFYPVVAPNPVEGKLIYAEKCTPCHGVTGLGDGERASQLSVPVAALGDPQVARQATPAEWFMIVTQGNLERFMPPFSSLNDRQRWDVVAYAFSLSETAESVAQGKALYEAECARCHGTGGLGDGPEMNSTAATGPVARSFIDQEFMASQSAQDFFNALTNGAPPNMPAYSQFAENERWALAAYLRSFTFSNQAVVAEISSQQSSQVGNLSGAPVSTPSAQLSTTEPTSVITQTLQLSTTYGTVDVEAKTAAGLSLPDDAMVMLYAFDEMSLVFTTTQATRAGDVFKFNNIEMPTQRAFLASVDYMGITYGSDIALVENPSQPLLLSIIAHETTQDVSNVVIDRLHMFFDFSVPDKVQVVQLYLMSNPSDKTVAAAKAGGAVLTFQLPEGAENLQFQDGVLGERYLEVPGGFADTQPVNAGATDYQVLVAFELPYKSKLNIAQPLKLNLNSAVVLLPEKGVKLKSEELVDGGVRDVQGENYLMFTGKPMSAGSSLSIELSGRPDSGASILYSPETRNNLLIGVAALGVVLIIAGVWLYRRERLTREEGLDLEDKELEDDLDNPEDLMDAIIALDDMYKAGELPEGAYQQRRAELKQRLEQQL